MIDFGVAEGVGGSAETCKLGQNPRVIASSVDSAEVEQGAQQS